MTPLKWVSPDTFPGTDRERVQAALDFAITNNRNVLIDREYNLGTTNVNGHVFLELKDADGLKIFGAHGGTISCQVDEDPTDATQSVVSEVILLERCRNVEISGITFYDRGTMPHDKPPPPEPPALPPPWGRVGAMFISIRNPNPGSGDDANENIAVRDCEFLGNGPAEGGAYSAICTGYQGETAKQVHGVTVDNCLVSYVRYGINIIDSSSVTVRRFRTKNVVRTAIMFGAKDVDIEASVKDPLAIRGVFGIDGSRGARSIRIRADFSDVQVWEEPNSEGTIVEKCKVRSFVNLGHGQVDPSPDNILSDIDLDLHFAQPSFGDASCVQFWSNHPVNGQELETVNRLDNVRISGNWPRKERIMEWASKPAVPCNLDISGLTMRGARFASGANFFYRLKNAQVWTSPLEFFCTSFEGEPVTIRIPDEIREQPLAMEITVHSQVSLIPRVGGHIYQGLFKGTFLFKVARDGVISFESPNQWTSSIETGTASPPTLSSSAPGELSVAFPITMAGSGLVVCRLL